MLRLTKDALIALKPCDLDDRLRLFGQRKSMTARQALDAGATVGDLLWVLGAVGRKDLCVRFALGCAQAVAHLSTDPRVEAALAATQAWLDDPSENNRLAAAAAAAAAAYAYAYADADAYAARSAADAYAYADADAYAAVAAAAAADAAAAAAAAAAADAAAAAAAAAQRELFLQIVEVA